MECILCACMARLVFVLCQPVHSCIEPSLHGLDFFLEIFLWSTVGYGVIEVIRSVLQIQNFTHVAIAVPQQINDKNLFI